MGGNGTSFMVGNKGRNILKSKFEEKKDYKKDKSETNIYTQLVYYCPDCVIIVVIFVLTFKCLGVIYTEYYEDLLFSYKFTN